MENYPTKREGIIIKTLLKRSLAMLLVLLISISVIPAFSFDAHAANYIYNWGTRGTVATELSDYAEDFYESNGTSYEELSAYSGGTSQSNAPSSALYRELKSLMTNAHSYKTSYEATKELYRYTDCQNGGGKISSFYSGTLIGPGWGEGGSWNREHTWPNSKGLGGQDENDIMMLRPTSSSENSSRGNKAYGQSSGYYHPNSESNGQYDLRGDVARIFLYVYVRWGNTSGNGEYSTWGTSGVMESVTVLLDWMEADPVDTWELGRNDAVESITGTRNVFVDYPELGFLLFGADIPDDMQTPSGVGSAKCDHNNFGAGTVVPATCETGGYTVYVCQTAGCGYSYKDNKVAALGHNYVSGACTRCGAAEPSVPHYVTEVTPGVAYKLGLYSTEKGQEYYFNGTMVNTYYGGTDTAFENGVDTYVEAVSGGYHLYFMNASNQKKYINLVLNDTHYNFTFADNATSVFTWDSAKNALYTDVSGMTCFIGNYGSHTSVNVLTSAKMKDTDYIARLYTFSGGNTPGGSTGGSTGGNTGTETPPACQHTYTPTVVPATCTVGGYTIYVCSLCSDSYIGNQVSSNGHNYVGDTCTVCGAKKGTASQQAAISFTDTSNRTSFSTTQQIWKQNGITVTNNKSSANDNVANYSNPVRFYKNSELIIAYPGMTKIEIDCHGLGADRIAPWKVVSGGATATESNGIVTITFASPVDSFTYSSLSAQCRAYGITVYSGSGSGSATGCAHTNITLEGSLAPTCTVPGHTGKTRCTDCNEIINEGKSIAAKGHTFTNATCTAAKTCSVCNTTEGTALGHAWVDATCLAPKTCSACNTTEGTALGHAWVDATCAAPKTCSVCTATEGEALEHTWVDATCAAPKTCSVCTATEGEALGHAWVDATCETPKTCSSCGEVEGEALGHKYADVTVEAPKTCTVCGATDGDKLPKEGLSTGAVVGIVSGSTVAAGTGGFSLFWFVIKKKKWIDLVRVFKK